jgi:hypothetical protein
VLALALAGCDSAGEEPTQFIALQHDFAEFTDWEVVFSGDGEEMPGHPAGERTVYQHRPEAPAPSEFAVGTIFVKTIVPPGSDSVVIHAMSKRTPDWGDAQAPGWEWFELQFDDEARPVIVWRGATPPDGECYGCIPGAEPHTSEGGDCATCHGGGASTNDSVWSVPLR